MKNKDQEYTTNDAGNPVSSDEFSLTVGPDGPILLQDHYLMEQMANFNREMIPDRQPHAKGSGAFGHLKNGVSEPVLERVFEYWRNIDKDIGDRIARGVKE